MPGPRGGFGAVRLGDGTVLVVGDHHSCGELRALPGDETATIYDPSQDVWRATGSLNKPRMGFAAVPTLDGGAMVIGGVNADGQPFSSTKIFDAGTGTWRNGPLLAVARANPVVAVAIGDGRIVVASPTKFEETSTTSTAEIYAPWTGQWADDGDLGAIGIERLMMLTDGRLLGVGYEFEVSGSMVIATPNGGEGWSGFPRPEIDRPGPVVPLPDGDILALTEPSGIPDPANSAVSRYDRATDRWVPAASIRTPRMDPITAILQDGRVLVAGGRVPSSGPNPIAASTEIYDPASDTWNAGPDLLEPRQLGSAVTLTDGSVLILGGNGAEFYGDDAACPEPLTSVERLTGL